MSILYLVRHAKPAATWGEAVDPGLDDEGRAQAEARAADLQARVPKVEVRSSPMRRCVETARPLTIRWQTDAIPLPQVAEIPSPPLSPEQRATWLAKAMQGSWRELQSSAPAGSPDYLSWRTHLLDALKQCAHDTVIFTHYIAINVAVGAAQGHDRVLSFRPGHASVTTLEVTAGRIIVRDLGEENAGSAILLGR